MSIAAPPRATEETVPNLDDLEHAQREALIEEARQRARRRRQRIGLIVAAVVGLALASYLVIRHAVASEAAAATNTPSNALPAAARPDRILHLESRWVVWGGSRTTFDQYWSSPDSSIAHVRSHDSHGAIDCVIRPNGMRCWDPAHRTIDVYRWPKHTVLAGSSNYVAYTATWPASLKRALKTGFAKRIGSTTLAGQTVDAILLAATGQPGPPGYETGISETLYVEPATLRPVADKMPAGGWTRYFDTFELVPNTKSNRHHLELSTPPNPRVVVHPIGEHPAERK